MDDGNPDNSSSFEKGHGLVDALAAVRVALGLDAPPGPSSFPEPPQLPVYEEEGLIFGAPTFIGFSVTEQEFRQTCMSPPPSQALDSYVFEIPEELREVVTAPFAFEASIVLELYEAGPEDAELTVTTPATALRSRWLHT